MVTGQVQTARGYPGGGSGGNLPKSAEETLSLGCCTHTPTESWGRFFWKRETTGLKKRSLQGQNNHHPHRGGHRIFWWGRQPLPSHSLMRGVPWRRSLPGCPQPGHGPGTQTAQRGLAKGFCAGGERGRAWGRPGGASGKERSAGRQGGQQWGGPDPRCVALLLQFCMYQTFYVFIFLMQKPS